MVPASQCLLTKVTALLSGKCDREQDGRVERAYVTEISLTTETPPESYWVIVKGFNLSYHSKETLLSTIDPYYGNLK